MRGVSPVSVRYMRVRIMENPVLAGDSIVEAYRAACGSLREAARRLECTEQTLHRWVNELGLRARLAEVRKELAAVRKARVAEGKPNVVVKRNGGGWPKGRKRGPRSGIPGVW